jgi:dihydroorotase
MSAAAAGGVTTSFAMPNVQPPPNTAERLDAMLELYGQRALIDWNVNAAGTVPEEIPALAERGIAAFKVFMVVDTGRDYPHMPGIGVHDHGKLLEIFETIAPTGVPLMVHPHDQALMTRIEEGFWARGERDARAYAKAYAAYDGIIWDTAVALLLRLQQATGTPLHLLHTQTTGVVELLRAAKARKQRVSAELNPWAVFLGNDWATIERLGSYALSYYVPEKNTEPLWEAMRDGTIDLVSTDHAPHLREEKEPGWTDGWKAHTGTPSTQFYVPLLLDAAARGVLSLERVVDLVATAPARVFGLAQKGRLEVGADADLAIVDPDAELDIRDDVVLSKIGWTPYAGRRTRGVIETTIVRGRVVYEDGRVTGTEGWGRQVRPTGLTSPTKEIAG